MWNQKVSHSQTDWLTRSPIELSWTAKNVFVLVLAHLEPELELEVDDIGDDRDDDF